MAWKRSEHWEMDDFAALVGCPSFQQLSAARIQKIQRALEMASGKGAKIAKWTSLLLLLWFPSFRQLSAAGNPENPRGPGNGFRKRSEYCEIDDFAAFVAFPLISAAFGGRKSENLKSPGNGFGKGANIGKWTILLLLWGSLPSFRQLSAAGIPENLRGPGNGFRKRSENCEMDDFAAFVWFPSFRQLSAAGNPENPRGPGNGFRKRSEYCEIDDFAAFVAFPLISAAFGGRKSRKSKEPWKWLPEKERTLGNGRFWLLLWGSPHFGSFRRPEFQKI